MKKIWENTNMILSLLLTCFGIVEWILKIHHLIIILTLSALVTLWIAWAIVLIARRPWNRNFRSDILKFRDSDYRIQDTLKAIFKQPYYETPYISCGSQRHNLYMNTSIDYKQIMSKLSIIIEDDPVGFIEHKGTLPVVAVDETLSVKDINKSIASCMDKVLNCGVLFIATPSRRLTEDKSLTLNRNIGTAISQLAVQYSLDYRIISKIDSCMRSNYEAEFAGLSAGLHKFSREILVPAYLEQGRITVHGTQYIQIGGNIIPIHQSEYASFSGLEFKNSNIAMWLKAKATHIKSTKHIGLIDIDEIRSRPYEEIAMKIQENANVKTFVFDCAEESDLTNIFNILCELEKSGETIFYKLSASMINELTTVYTSDDPEANFSDIQNNTGIIVAGSLSSTTKAQIDSIKDDDNIAIVLLSDQEIDNPNKTKIISKKTYKIEKRLENDNVILTTEYWMSDKNEYPNLTKRDKVLQYFAEICHNVYRDCPENWFLFKGSDTAFYTLKNGLNISHYYYCGHIIPGVIHCKFELDENMKSFFIIGGNVGEENLITKLIDHLNNM